MLWIGDIFNVFLIWFGLVIVLFDEVLFWIWDFGLNLVMFYVFGFCKGGVWVGILLLFWRGMFDFVIGILICDVVWVFGVGKIWLFVIGWFKLVIFKVFVMFNVVFFVFEFEN